MHSDRSVILVGLGATAATALEALMERFRVLALVRPGDDAVVQAAQAAGIRVIEDASMASVAHIIDALQPDAVVVSSYNRVLPAHMLQARPFINVHYAPLPRYRGRATVNWAIVNGESETAISIHCLTEELDAGGILAQQSVAIGPRDSVTDLYFKLNMLQRLLLGDAVERRLNGDLGAVQDEAAATYCCGRIPSDGMIDWSAPTNVVDRLIRSLGGEFPAAFTFLDMRRLDILRAVPADGRSYIGRVPGRVNAIDRQSGAVEVLTGDGAMRLEEIRVNGGRPQLAGQVITSTRMSLGIRTADLSLLLAGTQSGNAQEGVGETFQATIISTGRLDPRPRHDKVRQFS